MRIKSKKTLLLAAGVFFLACALSAGGAGAAAEPGTENILKQIEESQKSLKTAAVMFQQTKRSSLLKEALESQGIIYMDMPEYFLIKVEKPSPLIITVKDNSLIRYDPESSRVVERNVGSWERFLRKYLGLSRSLDQLLENYDVSMPDEDHGDRILLSLKPRREPASKYIRQIMVSYGKDDFMPKMIEFTDTKGNHTSLSLRFTAVNEPLPLEVIDIDLPRVENADDR